MPSNNLWEMEKNKYYSDKNNNDEFVFSEDEEDLENFSIFQLFNYIEGIGLFLRFDQLEQIQVLSKIRQIIFIRKYYW